LHCSFFVLTLLSIHTWYRWEAETLGHLLACLLCLICLINVCPDQCLFFPCLRPKFWYQLKNAFSRLPSDRKKFCLAKRKRNVSSIDWYQNISLVLVSAEKSLVSESKLSWIFAVAWDWKLGQNSKLSQ
jgi:hypothetical protein